MAGNITIFDEASSLPTVRRESKLADKMGDDWNNRRIATNTNGTFRRIVNGEPIGKAVSGEVDIIIVDLLKDVSRVYYAGAYDPQAKPTLPDCWSNLGVIPENNVPNVQSLTCNSCPQNVEGSGQDGRGKGCRYNRRVAVLISGDPSGEVYQMNFAAKSLFDKGTGNVHGFESYKKFLRANGEALDTVVTRVMYDLDAPTMTLKFKAVRHLTQDEGELVDAAQNDPATQRLIELTVAAVDGAGPRVTAPVVVPVAPTKPAPAPASMFADDDEPAEDNPPFEVVQEEAAPAAPTKRAKKTTPAPTVAESVAQGKSMADILSAWSEDED